MATIRIGSFGGMLPAIDENLLPDTAAVYAENCFLYSGALRPIPKAKVLHTLVSPASGYVYRIPKTYADADYLYDSHWMEFPSTNTNVLRSQVFNDAHDRYYFFSDVGAPRYNTKARILAGQPSFALGLNPPVVPPGVTPSGGVDVVHTRAYCYTWVTAYGEESAPSPPTVVTDKIDADYAITVTAPPLSDQGVDRNITTTRIYRTVTSDAGVATWYFVTEQVCTDTTYTDLGANTDLIVSLNGELESQFYTPPPALLGAVTMPNGMVAGWTATDIWFCEPYRMHAWPAKYGQAVEYPIVGLGAIGQSLVVCTQGYPVIATGPNPAFISMAVLTVFEPCLSRGSILAAPEGVYYASPSGLQLLAPGNIQNITREAATKDKWQKLTYLSALRAARAGTAYYAYGTARTGVFDEGAFETDLTVSDDGLGTFEKEDLTGSYLGILIDPQSPNTGIVQLRSVSSVINVLTDPWSGELFIIKEGKVFWLDLVDIETSLEVTYWDSKVFQTNQVKNFGALRLYFDVLPGSTLDDYGRVQVLADGHVVAMDRPIVKSGQLMRPSSGFKADYWQLKLIAQVKVKSVQMANSVKELNQV